MLNRNQVIQNSELSTSQDKKLNKKNRVDINILLNRVRADKKIIGRTTSGNYSFNFNTNLAFGYVNSGNTKESLKDKNIYIEVEKSKYVAELLDSPLNNNNYKKV